MSFAISGFTTSRRSTTTVVGTIKKIVLSALLEAGSIARFDAPIPPDYELYYNGQWFNKGQFGEIPKTDTTLQLPFDVSTTETIDIKYFVIV